MPGGRPTYCDIDLAALAHNYRVAVQAAGSSCAVWPVIKADAYGIGAQAAARCLLAEGAIGFCVAVVEEAEVLRRAGIQAPLALLSGCFSGQEGQVAALGLEPFVFDLSQAERLQPQGRKDKPVRVHLKVDTGMGRLGFSLDDLRQQLPRIERMEGLEVASVASHFARADEPWEEANRVQVARCAQLQRDHGKPLSCANSAALLALPESRFQWARPGIMLYGASPFFPQPVPKEQSLKPVVHWRSHIMQLRPVRKGTPLGYGHSYVSPHDALIAILPVGYGDGYPRHAGGEGLLRGQRVPLVGRVCMDLVAADVSALDHVTLGERVTLMGEDGEGAIPVEEIAARVGTIPYDILCRIKGRVPRRYYGSVSMGK